MLNNIIMKIYLYYAGLRRHFMVIACFGWEYYLRWRISLLRWWCFLCTAHWRFFACHSCQTYLGYLFLKDCVWLCWDPLQPLWVNHISHTQTQMQLTEAWKRGADRQRKQQLLLGGSSHTGIWRVEDGGRRTFSSNLPEPQVQAGQHRHPSLLQMDRLWSPPVVHGRVSKWKKDFGLIYNNI